MPRCRGGGWTVAHRKSPTYCQITMALCMGAACLMTLTACEKQVNPNDLPVSYWADPKSLKEDGFGYANACSLASAQAILKTGLPFPNYGTQDELAADGTTIRQRIKTVDVWLGGTRFVFPAALVSSSGYPAHNPNRFDGLQGTLPHFYPKGPHAPVKDGMGAMVDVKFVCSMDARYVNYKRAQSNEEAIERVVSTYQERARSSVAPGVVSVSVREDLGMTEVLLDRGSEAHNQRYWEATYFPLRRELKDTEGGVSPITCRIRHDPTQKRYGGVGHTCSAGIGMVPHAHASITIYVSHLEHMPSIFDQVQQVILNAKKAAQ